MTRDEVVREYGTAECVKRDEVLRYDVFGDISGDTRSEADPNGDWVRYDDHAKALAAVEAERDKWEEEWNRVMKYWDASVARVTRAERILSALREPSEGVRNSGISTPVRIDAIRAAVAAAEREVDRA